MKFAFRPPRPWAQSWPKPATTPRRRRTTCCTPRTSRRDETSTKRCGRSDRATPSSVLTSLSPCEGRRVSLGVACPGRTGALSWTLLFLFSSSWTFNGAVFWAPVPLWTCQSSASCHFPPVWAHWGFRATGEKKKKKKKPTDQESSPAAISEGNYKNQSLSNFIFFF